MQIVSQKIAPCLWFDTQAEEAAKFYVSIFKESRKSPPLPAIRTKAGRSTARRLAR